MFLSQTKTISLNPCGIKITKEEYKTLAKQLCFIPFEFRAEKRKIILSKFIRERQAQNYRQEYFLRIKEEPKFFKYKSVEDYAKDLKNILYENYPDFKMLPELRSIIDDLIFYFYGFQERTALDLKKGIILLGNTGCGKSLLMNFLFKISPTYHLVVKSALELTLDAQKRGINFIERYDNVEMSTPNGFGNKKRHLCIDDIGSETVQKYYGNEVNVIQSVLEMRYLNNAKTFGTSNFTIKQFENAYGARVASRMKEMFNFVDMFNLPDFRQ